LFLRVACLCGLPQSPSTDGGYNVGHYGRHGLASMHERFGLVLMVTHRCNLSCDYCYAGCKSGRTMPEPMAGKAVDRAVASLKPCGALELGFFGGEPLLEAELVAGLIDYARNRLVADGRQLVLSLTTNGTIFSPPAWAVMIRPDLDLAVSCDGLPEVHDRHRHNGSGNGSSEKVVSTIRRLLEAGKDFRVVMVVRPDTVGRLVEGVRYLQSIGVRHMDPSLDVWTRWGADDIAALQAAIADCARVWRDGLPYLSISWFDEKAAQLARIPIGPTARCGFGHGELAVAPSGRLYPCERLIGEDAEDNPMRMVGHVMDGDDFLVYDAAPGRSDTACDSCTMLSMCNTICRCSNYVRTGDVTRPDWLLCAWNQACLTETAKVLNEIAVPPAEAAAEPQA